MERTQKINILLIGHLPLQPSGSALSFKRLVDILSKCEEVELQVVNTSRPSHLTTSWFINFATAFKVTMAVLLHFRRTDVVSFHASRPAVMVYGPFLWGLTRLFNKPILIRLFGGALEKEYAVLSPIKKWIFNKTVLASDGFMVQTKHLLKYFEQFSTHNIKWFPNSTKITCLPNSKSLTGTQCKRYIFLGIIKEEKGIDIILDSVPYLMPGISVDLFGPLEGKYTPEYIDSKGKEVVCYRGILGQTEVYDELFNYDALILPTFYEGEGYPGVILEAYSHGLPVIATHWRSIPEIVDERTGILIPTHSAEALAQAMNKLHIDTQLYGRLSDGAHSRQIEFSDTYWADRFVEWCRELAGDHKKI